MRDNDYIVLVDENGQPYIAHSLFGNVKKAARSAGSRAHKYIAKWGEGAKARYFYTQEELKSAMNQGKQKVKDTVDNMKQKGRDVIGITAKEKMKAASNDMRRAHAENNKDYNEYRKARRDSMGAEYAAMKADAAKTYANWNVDKAKAEAARARAEVDHDRSELNKAENRYQQQHEMYYGDENSLGKTIERAVSKSAREEHAADKKQLDELNTARSDAYKTAKAGEQVLQEAYDAQRRAMSEKRMADKEADKANRDYTVSKEKRIDASLKSLESDVSSMEADQAYRRARAEYAATPLAKINAAKDKVSEAVSNAKDKVSDVVGDVKDKVKDIRNKHTEIGPSDEKLMDQYVKSGSNVPSDHDKPKNDPKIDISNLADNEYVYALGSNTGHAGEVKKVKDAEHAYNTAMRNYNRIAASKNASGQDKNAAKREMEKMKRDYESLLNDLVDTLNKE